MSDADDIDFSSPMLVSEDYLYALLLDSITEACSTTAKREITSRNSASYARALRELIGSGFLDLQEENGNDITALITEKGSAYIARLLEEERANGRA